MRIKTYFNWIGLGIFILLSTPSSLFADLWDSVGIAIEEEDYNEAAGLLKLADQNNFQVQRVLGVCLMKTGNLTEAETHLRRAIDLQGDSSAARYYLAQVLALRGDVKAATYLLEEVIDLAPNSDYSAMAKQIIPQLEQLKQTLLIQEMPKRWDLYISLIGEYDENVPARSKHEPASNKESVRLVTSLHVGCRITDQRLSASLPTFQAGYTYYRSFHEDSAFSDFDVSSHNARLELSKHTTLFGKWAELGIEGYYSETELGDNPFNDTIGLEVSASVQLRPSFLSVVGYTIQWKEFDDDSEFPDFFSRDGEDQEITLGTYAYLMDNRVILGLNYGYLWNNVDGMQFELNRHQITGSATLTLPGSFRFNSSVRYANEDYEKFTPDPKRQDDAITLNGSLSRPLWNENFRIDLNVTYTTSDSSRDFAEYNRAVYGLGFNWSK